MRDWTANTFPKYKKALFLDRDGTINADTHFPHKVEDLQFLPGVLDGFLRLSRLPLNIIIISNQAGISLGRFTREQMSEFNLELRRRVEDAGGRIDAFYYCPHLEPKHLNSKEKPCECSKPAPGLIFEAEKDFDLNLTKSYLIGDRLSDIEAGERAGCITILIKSSKIDNYEHKTSYKPKHIVDDFLMAVSVVENYLK